MCAWVTAGTAAPADAQSPAPGTAPGMQFRLRLAGQSGTARVRDVTPVPFSLDVRADGASAGRGVVEIHRLPDPLDDDDRGRLLYRAERDFTAGRQERITGFLPLLGNDTEKLEARWLLDGAVVQTSRADLVCHLAGGEPTVWVVTDKPVHARLYDSVPKAAKQWLAAQVELGAMPASWIALAGTDCLVIDRLSPGDAARIPEWAPALRRWVETGGTLVVTPNGEYAHYGALAGALLPVTPSGAALGSVSPEPVVAALGIPPHRELERFVAAEARPGSTVIAVGANGVQAAMCRVGLGRVVWLGCELGGRPGQNGRLGAGAVGLALAGRRDDLRQTPIADPSSPWAWGWGNRSSFQDGADLDAAAESISVPAPARSGLAGAVGAWAALLAVLFGLARWRGRLGTAWLAAVTAGLVGFVGLTAWARLTFAGRAAASSMTVTMGALGSDAATSLQGSALYVPAAVEAQLGMGPGWPVLVSPLDTRLDPAVTTTVERDTASLARLASRSTQRFRGYGRTELGDGIRLGDWRAALRRRSDTLRVTNGSALPLTDVAVLLPIRLPSDDEDGAAPLVYVCYRADRVDPGHTVQAMVSTNDVPDPQLLLRRMAASESETDLEAAERLRAAAAAFALRARNQAGQTGSAVLTATVDAPPVPLRIDGSAAPTAGAHVVLLFDAAPAPPRVTGLITGAALDVAEADLAGTRRWRGRLTPAMATALRRRRGGGNRVTRKAQPAARLEAGIASDVTLFRLPELSWNTTLAIELGTHWTLLGTQRGTPWTQSVEHPGRIEIVEVRDAFSGTALSAELEPATGRILIHHPPRVQTPQGITLKLRFLPPPLPSPPPPPGALEMAAPGPAPEWEAALTVTLRALEARPR